MAKAGVKHSLNSAYSKWDNLEISDDESEVHPNIDRNSWFRMRHRQRVEREEQEQKEQEALQAVRAVIWFATRQVKRSSDPTQRAAA
jgi:cell division cycle protein 37